jgi:hypothetical protein
LKTRCLVAATFATLGCWSGLQGCQLPDYADYALGARAGSGGSGPDSDGGASSAGIASAGATVIGVGAASDGTGTGASSGDASKGGSSGAGSGGSSPESCGTANVCTPLAPAGWLGPIALWEDSPGSLSAPPSCPAGYGQPTDLHGQLLAPIANCSCTCTATAQRCDTATTVSVYGDLGCATQCISASPVACAAVSGCTGSAGTLRAAIPAPSQGSCVATVSPKTPPPPQWKRDARTCTLNTAASASCADTDETCVPVPTAPYASHLCVYQVVLDGQNIPACPAAYPNPSDPLYSSYSDNRGCMPCSCSGPSGGSCAGTLILSGGNDCGTGFQYTLGSGCQSFSLSAPPSHIEGNYTLSAGTCAIAQDTQATGSAQGSGNARAVCCL